MFRDFTIAIYNDLLEALRESGYLFQTYTGYNEAPAKRVVILRHDVDNRNRHSLNFAQIQHKIGISGTYYFRMIPQSFNEDIIREIAGMGHEIGYHYEDMDIAKGDFKKAIQMFLNNLEKLRNVADVNTICMHGSPLGKYDNRELWNHYDYKDYGILAEPYFDLDFTRMLYLTDTGRRWDGDKVSIRDRVHQKGYRKQKTEGEEDGIVNSLMKNEQNPGLLTHTCHSTQDIIRACRNDELPDQMMFNFHPQRWTDHQALWMQELVIQNVKNVVKRGVRILRKKRYKSLR